MGENNYYVYEHVRLDNMTCFYIGKGKLDRAYEIGRNKHHDLISNKYGYAVSIVADNLSEKDAHQLERDLIEEYVFDFGYGINIKGCRNYENNCYLTNATWGGEGCSGRTMSKKTREKIGRANKGRKPSRKAIESARLKKIGKHHTEESKRKIGLASLGRNSSSENWQAKKVVCLNDKREFSTIKEAGENYNLLPTYIVRCCKRQARYCGTPSGERLVFMYYKEYSTTDYIEIDKRLKESLQNKKHLTRKVTCITLNKLFNSIEEARKFCNMKSGSSITNCCKGKRNTAGEYKGIRLKWKFYKENEKKVSI